MCCIHLNPEFAGAATFCKPAVVIDLPDLEGAMPDLAAFWGRGLGVPCLVVPMEKDPADAGRPENMGGGWTGLAKAGDWVAAFAKREGMGVPCLLKDSSGAAVGSGEGRGRGNATLLRKACDLVDGAGG